MNKRGRPNSEDPRDRVIKIRMTDEEIAEIDDLSLKIGLKNRSETIRYLIQKYMEE